MIYKYPNKISFYKFLLNIKTIARNPIVFHNKMFNEKGDTFAIKSPFLGHIILTRDVDLIKHIHQKNHKIYQKSKIQTKDLSKYVGYGLLTSNDAYWLQQRRLIQPAFHKEKIQNLVTNINEAIKIQVADFKTDEMVDLYASMHTLTFEVISKSLFDISTEKNNLKRLQFIIEKLQLFIVKELREPYKKFWLKLNGAVKYHMTLVKESRDIINSLIEARRASKENHDDLLDMLMHAKYEDGSSMTNNQLIDEILILFVAGHETTANALTFTLKLIAEHKDVLQNVEKEIKQVDLQNLTPLEALAQLQYTKQCIEESMRLYPPVWITDRVNIEDDQIGDYFIKKGTIIGASIYELHRNTAYWKNPERFDPERFSEANKKENLPYYMPFGAGPRLCIGNNFAMYEMILAVYEILKTFKISSNQKPIEVNPLITLKPIGLQLKFEKKNARV